MTCVEKGLTMDEVMPRVLPSSQDTPETAAAFERFIAALFSISQPVPGFVPRRTEAKPLVILTGETDRLEEMAL